MSILTPLTSLWAWLWTWLRDITMVLRPCRFSATIVLGGIALLFTDQGQELTGRLPDEPLAKVLWFTAAVSLWALESWYWARVLLDVTFGAERRIPSTHPRAERIHLLVNHSPRVLAMAAYGVAAFAAGTAASVLHDLRGLAITLWLVVVSAASYYALVKRRSWVDRYLARPGQSTRHWLLPTGDAREGLRALPPLSRAFLWASLALAGALTAWVCVDAVGLAWCLGGAAVPFIGFAMIVPVGSLLVFFARQSGSGGDAVQTQGLEAATRGYPVVIPLFMLAVFLGLFPFFDNHEVRKLGRLQPRPDFKGFVESWRTRVPAPDSARPIIVATAGGGLRAAYWTATVLGRIQDQAPDFRKQLLAISGVSGGSLGATVFVTLLGQSPRPGGTIDCRERDGEFKLEPANAYECAGQTVLSHDFLGPTVAAMLFPDLIQRFTPFPLFPDRAKGLEQGWERAWESAGYAPATWSGADFQDLWRGEGPLPALFLNGTHVETGRRVITSNVRITREPFADTYDFFNMTHASVRPSTAAHNSARFTYVSPAGTLRDRRIAHNELKGDALIEARRTDGTRIVDGGYFENFGAVTVRQALRAALALLRRPGVEVRPIVILISNEPKLEAWEFPPKAGDVPQGVKASRLASEVLSPLRALLKTRDARGLLAVAELWIDVGAASGDYFQFRLCPDLKPNDKPGRADPALGWVLSQQAEALMREQLRTDACGNASEFKRLMAVLKPA